ncbi:unnamed protein product [Linum trigynum]|uniref:Uncharacterized protein n=1 Tax=Linum trigynum TaxID=586398 RepID=A0AAV2FF93_9ROSI
MLDRAVCNTQWLQSFPESFTTHLTKVKSDHRPILDAMERVRGPRRGEKPIHFLSPWMQHNDFSRALQEGWAKGDSYRRSLALLTMDLRNWNKEVFEDIFARKRRLMAQLNRLEMRNESHPSPISLKEKEEVQLSLQETRRHEAALWYQKARAQWFVEGDLNTRFFHLATLKRRSADRIRRLKREDGDGESFPSHPFHGPVEFGGLLGFGFPYPRRHDQPRC